MTLLHRRLLWLTAIALAAALFVFGNDAGTLTVLLTSILLPPLCLLYAVLSGRHISAITDAPGRGWKNEPFTVTLTVRNDGLLPAVSLVWRLNIENTFTGERAEILLQGMVPPKGTRQLTCDVTPLHCGLLQISVGSAVAADPFGLFSREMGIANQQIKCVTVSPAPFPMEVVLKEDVAALEDSDVYSTERAGTDPSETYAIREYLPGDPIRSIHWKLSEKAGKVLVRELSLPLYSGVLLLFETAVASDPARMDAAASVFASLSFALAENGVSHTVGWHSSREDTFVYTAVADTVEAAAATDMLLSASVANSEETVLSRFVTSGAQIVSHVAVVVPHAADPSAYLCAGSRVTILSASEEASGQTASGDVRVICFTVNTAADEFTRLEL